jgi:hypothetical protein
MLGVVLGVDPQLLPVLELLHGTGCEAVDEEPDESCCRRRGKDDRQAQESTPGAS